MSSKSSGPVGYLRWGFEAHVSSGDLGADVASGVLGTGLVSRVPCVL